MNKRSIRKFIQVFGTVILGAVVGAVVAQGAVPWTGPVALPPNENPDLLVLEPLLPQVDDTARNSIHVQDDGSGGDLIRLEIQGAGVPSFVVGNDGNTGVGKLPGVTVSPPGDPIEFDVAGDVNADRLCLDGDCRDDWAAVLSGGGPGGTANRVVKWITAGDGIEDTTAPIVDVGGLVGIGPTFAMGTLPAFTLDVDGPANATQLCIAGTCINTWSDVFNGGTPGDDNYLPKWTLGGTRLINSTVYEDAANNVGIGTTTPGARLDVDGNLLLSGAGGNSISAGTDDNRLNIYNQTNSTNSRAWIEMWGSGGRTGELTLAGTYISFYTNSTIGSAGSERARLTSGGDLKIGDPAFVSSIPTFQLDVQAQANADELCLDGDCRDNWGEVLSGGTTGTANRLVKWNAAGNGFVDTVAPIDENGSGNVGIGTAPSGSYRVDIGGDANATRICVAGDCKSAWSDGGIGTDNQNLYLNVSTPAGIATADTPTDTLVLAEAGGIDLRASGDTITIDIDSSQIQTRVDPVGCPPLQAIRIIAADGSLTCANTSDGDWVVSGSNLYSAVSGNVGIGDSTPNAKLDVEGTARFDYPGGSARIQDISGLQVFDAEGSSGEVRLGAAWGRPGVYSSTSLNLLGVGGLALSGRGNTTDIYITTSGRVGMGTTSPSNFTGWASALQVNGEIRAARYYDDVSAFYVDSNATSIMNSIHASRVYDRDNTAYYSDPASTSYYNDMRANIYYDRNNTAYYANPASTSYFNDMRANIYYDRNNTAYYANPASTSRFNVITTAGNVGIGTTSATKRLDVRGQVRIDQGSSYDVWIQGGSCGTGNCRNLALLGVKTGDQLRINFAGEYTGGTRIDGNVYANGYFYLSDRSQKRNIQKLDSASTLKKILQLDAVSFNWADSGEEGLGFIAQDVEKLFPEIVRLDKAAGLKSVNYGALTGPIVEAIQAQQPQMDALEAKLERLERELREL